MKLSEAVLIPGDEHLNWYSFEMLVSLGLNRGLLDQLVINRSVRWVSGKSLLEFLASLNLGSDASPHKVYYQVSDLILSNFSAEGTAARTALQAMGVASGETCQGCKKFFPREVLVPDKFKKLYCVSCVRGRGQKR